MTSQSTKKVGGGSPTNPDSTCQAGDEMNQIEARIQAMEERLLKDQETKFKTLLATINASKATGADNHTSTNQVGLEAGMKDLKEKIEHLVSGENEANKMIDELKRTDSLATQLDNNEERADKFRQVVFDQLKDLNEESKHNKKYLKDIERELDHLRHDIKDLKEIERKNTDLLRSNNKKLDIVERQTRTAKRRRSTRSRSGSSRSGSRRRSRSSSTSRSRRKSSRSKRNVNSRDSSVSAAIQMKSNDFEKLLVQINDSIGVLGEKVEKNEVIDLVKETLVPQVLSIKESLVPHVLSIKETLDRSGSLLTFPAPKWDEAESPSPLRKPPGTPSTVSEAISLKLSEERASGKSSAKSSKKKRKRSRSSSSSSSDDEVMDSKDLKQNVKIIGNKVSQIDLRLKEIGKSLKKTTKMEDNSATVLKRVHEMAMGVQIIAENVDSMNDVGKRLEVIEDIKESFESLESLPKRLKGLDEKVGMVSNSIENLSDMVSLKVRDIEGYLDGSKGRRCSTDEYGDVTNLLIKLEEENSKKFCEFGGLVETLQEAIVRRLEKMESSDGGGERGVKTYLNTLLDTHEKLIDHVKNVERIQKKEIVPGLNNLLSLGGAVIVGAQPPGAAAAAGSPSQNTERTAVSAGGSTDQRIAALVLQLSQLQPRLDDLYIRVLPSLENLTSRVRKVEDRDRLAASEDTQHIQKILDIVEDMKEERKTMKVEGGLDTPGGFNGLSSDQAGKLDDIFKAVYEAREAITSLHAESSAGMSALTGGSEKLLKLSDSAGKMLDTLMKNSNSDAKTISGLNTSLQSMKASVNGVNTTAKDQLATAKELRECLSNISAKVTDLEASSVAVETKLQTEVVTAFSTLKDDLWELIDHNVKEMIVGSTKEIIQNTSSRHPEPQHPTSKTASQAQLIKMQECLDKLISKVTLIEVNLNITSSTKSKSHHSASSSSSSVGILPSKVSEDLDLLGKEIKSQLDDVHDMVASMEEKLGGSLEGIKNDLSVHDKHTGVSFNKIALVMRDILDNSKQAYEQIPGIETKIMSAMKESSTSDMKGIMSRLEAAIKESSKVVESKDMLKMAEKLDQLNTKHDKIGKIVGRIK